MASRNVKTPPRGKPSGLPFFSHFTDVARQAGLKEIVVCGHPDRNDYIIESMSCGAAFLDFDNDGWLDILSAFRLALRRSNLPLRPTASTRTIADGTFTDITEKAGLFPHRYAYGVTVGDYDNDGFDDLFITYWGQNVLYRNNGNGTFTDVTEQAGLLGCTNAFWLGLHFVDYDRDGHLDLFVSHYLDFDPLSVPRAGSERNLQLQRRSGNCGPRGLPHGSLSLSQQRRRYLYRCQRAVRRGKAERLRP